MGTWFEIKLHAIRCISIDLRTGSYNNNYLLLYHEITIYEENTSKSKGTKIGWLSTLFMLALSGLPKFNKIYLYKIGSVRYQQLFCKKLISAPTSPNPSTTISYSDIVVIALKKIILMTAVRLLLLSK
jgi:hypothetical protein